MLSRLRIQNFKGWSDTGDIKLSPLTLFFGSNSSGKSSIGQFLMMLKQTIECADRGSVFSLGTGADHSHVQLGSYRDIVFGHDLERSIDFSYAWHLREALEFKDPHHKNVYRIDGIEFESSVKFQPKSGMPFVSRLAYLLQRDGGAFVDIRMEKANKGYELRSEHYGIVRNPGRVWPIPSAMRFYGFPDEASAYYQNTQFVQDLNLCQENLFRSLYYLGPLRTKPNRIYSWPGNTPDGVGDGGENTIPAILAARNRTINLGAKKRGKSIQTLIAESLKRMGLIEEFTVDDLSKHGREYEVKVRTRGAREFVNLPDVGFGVSQVLPVLAACFCAQPGSILIMEQPEIHLHPSAQAVLADVMIDVLRSRENGADRDIQLLIETHSEHFLRRLQRRMAEGVVTPDDASVYFVKTDCYPVKLESLELDLFGNASNWPTDFFGDTLGDLLEQAKVSAERRAKMGAS